MAVEFLDDILTMLDGVSSCEIEGEVYLQRHAGGAQHCFIIGRIMFSVLLATAAVDM